MEKAFKNSLICRILMAITAAWRDSGTHKLCSAFAQVFRESLLGRAIRAFLASEAAACAHSRLRRIALWVNSKLHAFGTVLEPAWEGFFARRLWKWFIKKRIVTQSLVLSHVFYPGMRRLLIVAFALYLPIDWALRDVLSISFLASIWDEAFLLCTALYILARRIFDKELRKPVSTPMDAAILLFLGVGAALMFVISPRFYIAVQGYRATVQYILWFFLLLRLFEDKQDINVLYGLMVAIGTLIAFHGIYQFIIGAPIPSHWQTSTEVAVRTRVYSIFGSPNIMGCFMVMIAPMAASAAYACRNWWIKLLAWGCVFIMCLACLFTFSRGAWLGMAVAVLIFALIVDRKLLLLLAVAVAGGLAFVPGVRNRILFLFTEQFAEASSGGGRVARRAIGLNLLKEAHPFLGFGLGRYGGAVAMNNQVESRLLYYYLDNYYLRIMVEMGYAGFGAYILMMLTNIVTGLRATFRRWKSDRGGAVMCAGMLAGMCGTLTHCMFENIFEEPYMMAYFWGMAAMVTFLGFVRGEKTE